MSIDLFKPNNVPIRWTYSRLNVCYCILNYEYFPFFIRFSHFHSQWTLNEHILHVIFFSSSIHPDPRRKKNQSKNCHINEIVCYLGFYCYTKPPSFSFSLSEICHFHSECSMRATVKPMVMRQSCVCLYFELFWNQI